MLGVRPEALDKRGAFTFTDVLAGDVGDHPWLLLNRRLPDGAIPAIAEAETIQWALGRTLGNVLTFRDDTGREFNVRLVGAIENSILQGTVIIAEDRFVERFPSEAGHRLLLIDTPAGAASKARKALEAAPALRKLGLDVTPAAERLAAFLTVKNTYLTIFQVLGGLGLGLGSVALGVVVLRNVLERRSELAILRAVGFAKRSLQWLVVAEHWLLLAGGLACGAAAGIVAVLPALVAAGVHVPYASLAVTLSGVVVSGAVWIVLATRLALRGELLPALRQE